MFPCFEMSLKLIIFLIIFLKPKIFYGNFFAEEIRSFDDVPSKRADEDQVIIAEKFMKKLRFNYKVESFQNPRIRTHWAAIEALALDLSEAEEVGDSTCKLLIIPQI